MAPHSLPEWYALYYYSAGTVQLTGTDRQIIFPADPKRWSLRIWITAASAGVQVYVDDFPYGSLLASGGSDIIEVKWSDFPTLPGREWSIQTTDAATVVRYLATYQK